MADNTDTTQEQNSSTPTTPTLDPSAQKDVSPAPASSDTPSSTTENPSADADEGSLLNPKTVDTEAEGEKTEDAAGAEGEKDAAAELFGAPEEGTDYEITGLPEGITLDADAIAAVTPLARELNLSSTGLSKLAAVYAESVLPNVVAQTQEQVTAGLNAQIAEIRKGWATESRLAVQGGRAEDGSDIAPDKVFAGATLADVQKVSAKAIDRFGGSEFRQFLDDNGLGNHPAMLRFAFQAGSAISEDTNFDRGGSVPSAPLTREEKYYGKQA